MTATQVGRPSDSLQENKKFAKQMLKNAIFVGTYQEKRFVENLNSYRDVISVAPEETQFIENLIAVRKRIIQASLKRPWIGIIGPETAGSDCSYCLLVELTDNIFGQYWYKVKTVEFLDGEVRLKLETVRQFKQPSSPCKNALDMKDITMLGETVKGMPLLILDKLVYICRNNLTYDNTKNTVIFTFLLISTLFVGLVNAVKYLLEYLLKLIREISGLVKAITPLILNLFNLIQRIIFGLYHMIIMLLRKQPQQQPVYNILYNPDFADPQQRYNQYISLPGYPNQGSRTRIRAIQN